jgi:hypothetical protein
MTMATRSLVLVLALLVAATASCRKRPPGGAPPGQLPNVSAHRPAQAIQPKLPSDHGHAIVAAPVACYTLADKHAAFGGAATYKPTTAEIDLADDKQGKLRRFVFAEPMGGSCTTPSNLQLSTVSAAIYWSPQTCAHLVRGPLLQSWERQGGPRSHLGYPITDELAVPEGGLRQLFEGGELDWTPAGGVTIKRQ